MFRIKNWMIKYYLKNSVFKGGRYIFPHAQKLADLLKKVSKWIFAYGFSDRSYPDPPVGFPGWVPELGRLRLIWFYKTKLHKFYEPWKTAFNQERAELFAQMKFSRALPPPLLPKLLESAKTCISRLSNERKLEIPAKIICECLDKLRYRMGKANYNSHFSISNKSCYEDPKTGRAGAIRKVIEKFKLIRHNEIPVEQFYDCCGEIVVSPHIKDVPIDQIDFDKPPEKVNCSGLLWKCCYKHFAPWNKTDNIYEDRRIARFILLCCFSEAAKYGDFYGIIEDQIYVKFSPIKVSGLDLVLSRTREVIWKMVKPPPTRLQVLAEPGNKARTLGIPAYWVTTILQVVRQNIEPIFHKDYQTGIGFLLPAKMWTFHLHLKRLVSKGKWKFSPKHSLFSSDLTAATDMIPNEFIRIVWKWISQKFSSNILTCFLDLIVGEREIFPGSLVKRVRESSFIQKSGSLMGSPVSFITLTLLNMVVNRLAAEMFNLKQLIIPKTISTKRTFLYIICGDDNLTIAEKGFQKYLYLAYKKVGAIVNKKVDKKCQNHGFFCECHIWYSPHLKKIIYFDNIFLRLLTPSVRLHRDGRAAVLGRGTTLFKYLEYSPYPVVKLYATYAFREMFRHRVSRSYLYKCPISLPQPLGGLSFPLRNLKELNAKYGKFLYALEKMSKLDWGKLIPWAYCLQQVTCPQKRGVNSYFSFEVVKKIFSFIEQVDEIKDLDDIEPNKWYNGNVVADLAKKLLIEQKEYLYDAEPNWRYVFNYMEENLSLLTAERLLQKIKNIKTFNMLLKEPQDARKKIIYNFPKYTRRYSKLIKRIIGNFNSSGETKIFTRKEIDLISKRIRSCMHFVCHNTSIIASCLGGYPSLEVELFKPLTHLKYTRWKSSIGKYVPPKYISEMFVKITS
jgi:hypothetical protein